MNTPHTPDPLESELESLTPVAPDPELRSRLAAALESEATATRERNDSPVYRLRWWAIAAAACVVGAVIWFIPTRSTPTPAPPTPIVVAPAPADAEVSTLLHSPASLWSYHRVLANSPETFEATLDKHARETLPSTPAAVLADLHR